MPTYEFDFSLDAWIRGLKIDADSEEEAKDKLSKMSVDDIIQEGYVKDYAIKDLDCEELEEDL